MALHAFCNSRYPIVSGLCVAGLGGSTSMMVLLSDSLVRTSKRTLLKVYVSMNFVIMIVYQ
jgi:hypothetical protein